jgi:hypothetical protein
MPAHPTLAAMLCAGILTGGISVALFGLAHALLIQPIWNRLGGGIPFGIAAGAGLAWAYYETLRTRPEEEGSSTRRAAAFGVLLWLAVLPTTLFGALLRLAGRHDPESNLQIAASILVAALCGAGIGRALTHNNRRGPLAMGTAAVVLVLAQAGPVPITNSRRAAGLFLALLLISVACAMLTRGLAHLLSVAAITARSSRSRPAPHEPGR